MGICPGQGEYTENSQEIRDSSETVSRQSPQKTLRPTPLRLKHFATRRGWRSRFRRSRCRPGPRIAAFRGRRRCHGLVLAATRTQPQCQYPQHHHWIPQTGSLNHSFPTPHRTPPLAFTDCHDAGPQNLTVCDETSAHQTTDHRSEHPGAAPEKLRVGERITRYDVATQLRLAGYSEAQGDSPELPDAKGRFRLTRNGIQVMPGPDSYFAQEAAEPIGNSPEQFAAIVERAAKRVLSFKKKHKELRRLPPQPSERALRRLREQLTRFSASLGEGRV